MLTHNRLELTNAENEKTEINGKREYLSWGRNPSIKLVVEFIK